MNASAIYSEAIHGRKKDDVELQDKQEEKEQRDLRYLNYGMQQTSLEIKHEILTRCKAIDVNLAVLVNSAGNEYSINRLLLEKKTLTNILELFKTGIYANT